MVVSDRIQGWKAIGAHFGRDRTTAMRWAQTRGLPVHRLPGGKTGSVFAFRAELDAWALSHDVAEDGAPEAVETSKSRTAPSRRLLIGAGVGVVVAAVAGGGLWWTRRASADESDVLPADPALAAIYLQARDDWALRTPESLTRAISGLETVTLRDPRFAPAFSALADAYLLAGEFGTLEDEVAFPNAKAAAQSSLALDPDLAAGHRALGFVAYWWDGDPVAAGRSFRRALQLAPNSAQTHFWYGNVLSDNGHHQTALLELSRARLLEPGSVPIQTDLAWAYWRAGRQDEAVQALNEILAANPSYSAAHDCLAEAKLSVGDYEGYVASFAEYARLRADRRLIGVAREQREALETGGVPRLQAYLLDQALERVGSDMGRNNARPAFMASLAGDREALLRILRDAEAADETWNSSGVTRRIRERWAGDAEIVRLLDRRRPAPVI